MKPWNEMNPREQDALIAEKIIGWREIEIKGLLHTSGYSVSGIRPDEVPSVYTGYCPKFEIPRYTTDIKAAWEVVEKIKLLDDRCLKFNPTLKRYEIGCTNADGYFEVIGSGKIAPETICAAAVSVLKLY
jgi:hypothetical protein